MYTLHPFISTMCSLRELNTVIFTLISQMFMLNEYEIRNAFYCNKKYLNNKPFYSAE